MELDGGFQDALNRQWRMPLPTVDHSAHNEAFEELRDSTSKVEHEFLLKRFSTQESTPRLPNFDYGRTTKILAYCGLAATWVMIACCIVFGISIGAGNRGAEVVVVNIVLTVCLDSLGYIHGSSLRWALAREVRLHHNTNLRLFNSARNQPQHYFIANALDGFSLIICYAATSQLFAFTAVYPHSGVKVTIYGYHVNGMALLLLAGGLAFKASISTWILISTSHAILTWSSNPLNNTLTLVHSGLAHNTNRCMLSVKEASVPSIPRRPSRKQASSARSVRSVNYVLMFTWTLPVLALGWFLAVWLFYRAQAPENIWSWDFYPNYTEVSHIVLPQSGAPTLVLAILFMAAIQAAQTIGLDAVELIVNTSRDENAWRSATCNKGGARLHTSALTSASLSWENMVLFIAKTVLHLLMGQAVTTRVDTFPMFYSFIMAYIPILVYFIGVFLLAIFTSYLAYRKPDGPQPAAYGHLQTIADLVGDWAFDEKGRLWWGDKGVSGEDGVRHAGTSCKNEGLGYIRMDALYG